MATIAIHSTNANEIFGSREVVRFQHTAKVQATPHGSPTGAAAKTATNSRPGFLTNLFRSLAAFAI